jgi:hypothetical protein
MRGKYFSFMTYSHLVGEGSSWIYLLNISGANLQIMTSGGYHLRTKALDGVGARLGCTHHLSIDKSQLFIVTSVIYIATLSVSQYIVNKF